MDEFRSSEAAEGRLEGSWLRRRWVRSIRADDAFSDGTGSNRPRMIFRMSAHWLLASKGWWRVQHSYRMTPSAHMSDLLL